MKITVALFLILTTALAAGCRCPPPYRTSLDSLEVKTCKPTYDKASWPEHDLTLDNPQDQKEIGTIQKKIRRDHSNPCWNTSREHHENFDLYSIEFDDQGWLARKADADGKTQLTTLVEDLERMVHGKNRQPLSLIIYAHGWHHSAAPDDTNVIAFRHLLEDASKVEDKLCDQVPKNQAPKNADCVRKDSGDMVSNRKVVGIYIGWRGDSVIGPVINELSIWDRKHAAETVALGSVQEFFARMHSFFLAHACHLTSKASERQACLDRGADVRMLTVGHSFGGLITYRALAPRLMLGIVETTYDLSHEDWQDFAYSYGDLTVLINPAFEATRFEPLAEAAACRKYVASEDWPACGPKPLPEAHNEREAHFREWQLPVLIVATSRTDRATGWFFPIVRWVATRLERVRGAERVANVKAVGWDQRYQTHDLVFEKDPKGCSAGRAKSVEDRVVPEWQWSKEQHDGSEQQHKDPYAAFDADPLDLPDCLLLTKAKKNAWQLNRPRFMPLWVIKADDSVINGHNDFLNPHFIDFVRQIYFAILLDTQPQSNDKQVASALAGSHDSSQ